MSLLRYTGHPLVDVGVATIVEASRVERPEEVTAEHLESFSHQVVDIYMRPGVAGHLSRYVFANAGFANPNMINNPKFDQSRRELLMALLSLWKSNPAIPAKMSPALSNDVCTFSGDPAVVRTSRMYIPMITGEDDVNFLPEGRQGLPVSGWCLYAILVMPLGSLKYGADLVIVHGTDPQILQYFASRNLERNLLAFHVQGLSDMPIYSFAKTYLIDDLLHTQHYPKKGSSLTAYQFNSDAKTADIRMLHLPSSVLGFIQLARANYPDTWNYVVQRATLTKPDSEKVKDKKTKNKKGEESVKAVQTYGRRNYFYEALFDLPEGSQKFLRRYLLRIPRHVKGKKLTGDDKFDPRVAYSYINERQAISWPLTELFLERIMRMDRQRIAKIRDLADALASYIQSQDRRLFKELFTARSEYHVRLALLKAANSAPGILVRYDDFVDVFFVDDGETMRSDWSLARDLLMVRVIERLHTSDWLEQNQELVEEANQSILEVAEDIS